MTEKKGPPLPPAEVDTEELEELFGLDLDWSRWWTIIPEIVVLVCTGGIPLLVFLGVIARYTDWFRVLWANDIVSVMFLWVVFLGGAIAVKYEAHVRMGSLADRLVGLGSAGKWWQWVIRLSPLALGAIFLILGWRIVGIHMTRELTWLQIPLGYFSVIIPISGILMIYYTVGSLRRHRSGDASTQTETVL